MEGRRLRRFGRGRQTNQTLLPVRFTSLSNTVSCWYCDFKFAFLNEPLFRFGRRHSRCLRVWFSLGVGFGLAASLGGIMILLWELGRALHLYDGNAQLISLLNGSLFRFSFMITCLTWLVFSPLWSILFLFSSTPVSISWKVVIWRMVYDMSHRIIFNKFFMSGMNISFSAIGYMCTSTILSVFVHEVGHAVAAASEGIQMEYVAVFLAVLFPGAIVALNHELLQTLPRFASLRIYCAGVWHNAAFCMVCALALLLLPLMLDPFYIHGESPMVLDVSPSSPLAGYLSPHDLIISLGATRIHTVQEWEETIGLLNVQILENFENSTAIKDFMSIIDRKGYCVPHYLIKESITTRVESNETTCPDDLHAFASLPCLDSHILDDLRSEENHLQGRGRIRCFNPKDIIELKKCGDGWDKDLINRSSCSCLEDESCFSPVQMPGLAWVEITYLRPSKRCLHRRNSFQGYKSADLRARSCLQSFVFIGDLISLGHSLHLTSYKPRWEIDIGTYFPDVFEKLLICAFHVSLTLAFLNSLPVHFLDGESILEVVVQYFSFLYPRTRRRILQLFLLGGTFTSVIAFLRIFFLLLR